MELLQLFYFREVAREQHMTKAAKNLHISQPAISKTIHALEDELNVPLFDRTGRTIVLNKYGLILLKYSDEIFNSLDSIHSEIAENALIDNNTITVSVKAASAHIAAIIKEFKKTHPDVSIKIIQMNSDKDFREDIGICSSASVVNKKCSHTLFREEIMLAVPLDDPLASYDKIDLKDLSDKSLIGLDMGQLDRTMKAACKKAGFNLKYALECDDPSTVRKFIKMGLGLAFVPTITWNKVTDFSDIRLLKIENPECFRYINLKWNPNTINIPVISQFRDFMLEYFRSIT